MKSSAQRGFALPTVLLASIVMMIVLMTALVASSGTRALLDEQFYEKISRIAAESGLAMAEACLRDNDFIPPWGAGTLQTGQNCNRTNNPDVSDYIADTATYRSFYRVTGMTSGESTVRAEGVVEVLRAGSGAAWQTHSTTLSSRTSSDLTVNKIGFGYHLNDRGSSYAGGAFFGVVARNGQVFTLGNNSIGQLGDGSTANRLTPASYRIPDTVYAEKITTKFNRYGVGTSVITTDGDLYVAGENSAGQLTGTDNPITGPERVSFPVATGAGSSIKVVGVEFANQVMYASLSNGRLYASGSCDFGKLGTGTLCSDRNQMTQVALPSGQLATDRIVANDDTAYVITQSGMVYGWGRNDRGQVGTAGSRGSTSTPSRIGTFGNTTSLRARSLSFDGQTLFVVTEGGQLYAIGDNQYQQIAAFGLASNPYFTTPQLINVSGAGCSGDVIDAKIDNSHVAVLTASGQVCTAGLNAAGQLARSSTALSLPLGRANLPTFGVTAESIWVNSFDIDNQRSDNTFVVGSDGAVYGAGSNYYGQLGRGSGSVRSNARSFVRMEVFGGPSQVVAKMVQSGMGTTVIVAESGLIYTVGNNDSGQLGDGTTLNSDTPRPTRYVNLIPPEYY